jgi:hypothetical protein
LACRLLALNGHAERAGDVRLGSKAEVPLKPNDIAL